MDEAQIEYIAELLAEGYSAKEIANLINEDEMDDLMADRFDDSDDGISRRYGISADDRFDIRGERLLPRTNEAGEPNWL